MSIDMFNMLQIVKQFITITQRYRTKLEFAHENILISYLECKINDLIVFQSKIQSFVTNNQLKMDQNEEVDISSFPNRSKSFLGKC